VLEKAERGRAVFRMPVLELHSRSIMSFMAGFWPCWPIRLGDSRPSWPRRGARVVTIEMKINFLEAVEHGEIRADARVLRQGRSTSVVDCEVIDGERRLVSKALMTFAVIPPKQTGRFEAWQKI